MANEITASYSLTVSKGNVSFSKNGSNRIDMAGAIYASGVVSVPTTAGGTAIGIGSVGTAGIAVFKNLDTSNSIQLGRQSSGPVFHDLVTLKPGEQWPLRLSNNAPYALAVGGTCLLEYAIFEA